MLAKSKKIAAVFGSFGLLALVGYADYVTGYRISLLVFYLLPILVALRYVGPGLSFLMAVLSAFVWLSADIAAGERFGDIAIPIWNTGIRMSVFVLVVLLFTNREYLQKLVDQRTRKLRQEIRMRSRLEKELLEIAESEQRRIGQDLHDSLGQQLTATALAGKVLAKKLANKSVVEPALADRLVTMVEEAIELTRNLARTLHPIELGAEGLENALKNLAANLSKAFAVSCRFQPSSPLVFNDPQAAIHLYRIAQEAASNAIRHGHARNIVISLAATNKVLMLSITDDGSGLPPEARAKNGMGLRIMNYRAGMIGGTFDIQNLPAGGARAVCVLNPNRLDPEDYGTEN